ncbi:molybdopterin converting factor subunit 1 [Crenobacter cavernae]|uniref:Molybdopterin synthase sulfur carrier subunit n=1 Tax=Crenobacter cavernae TaxID=2290923 RepID=A0ABY0FCJ4_9NEIS|nr:molybdopterin converting factor subunit 1 [Crenobacter cavernae]RXZ43841.1 molybdopterin converting factor subunit 1 [Crenobacter cavernae]
MTLKLLYFARLKESFGRAEETVAFDGQTVAGLIDELAARGGAWSTELAPGRVFRVAVNQELAPPSTELAAGDEVAIFPPVTGG